MKKSNINRKINESLKRQRQKEIMRKKAIRNTKRTLWEVVTSEDFHPSGHIRHWK